MGKYLTEFSSNTAYNASLASLNYPNVSLVANQLKYAESLPTMYRWVDNGDTICGDGEIDDGCTLFVREQKQQSTDGGAHWTNVSPSEYRKGDMIEDDSPECGCGGEGEGCEWNWVSYNSIFGDFENYAVIELKMDEEVMYWQQGTYTMHINSNCDARCPVLKLVIEVNGYDSAEVSIYMDCDCADGECPTLVATEPFNVGDTLNLYTYTDRTMIDDLHIDSNISNIPALLVNVAEGDCIDQC